MHALQPLPAHLPTIRRWLNLCLVLVVLMVAIGGVTRLSESGLSIVEWKLVSGTLPPLTDTAWQKEFAAYQTSPQYKQLNADFSLGDFQHIFWLEYVHRLLGRIIGMVVLIGTLCFGIRRYLPRTLLRRMIAICVLVAAQGTVGWIMVASGLVHTPRVAPVKLAAHLLLAFSLFMALLWTRWQVAGHERLPAPCGIYWASRALLGLVTIQLIFGALVAGLRAGLSYNTYPLMDGQFVPQGLYLLTPWWRNHLESVLTVQFQHRMGALVVAIAILVFVITHWKNATDKRLLKCLAATVLLQFGLGVSTLLSGVNLWLASAHQLVALLLVGLLTRLIYRCK